MNAPRTPKIVLILMMVAPMLACSQKSAFPKEVYVIAKSGLLIRKDHNTTASKVGLAPYGSKMMAMEQKAESMLIQGKVGKWTRVVFEDTVGWSFGGFLSPKAPPPLGEATKESNQMIRCDHWDTCQAKCYTTIGEKIESDAAESDPRYEELQECYDKCTRQAGGHEYVDSHCPLGC